MLVLPHLRRSVILARYVIDAFSPAVTPSLDADDSRPSGLLSKSRVGSIPLASLPLSSSRSSIDPRHS
jgi:hypothetical protein